MSNTLRLPVAGCRLPVLGKRGALGEWVVTLYRLLVVSFVAFIILGVSSVFYAHYIDVRDAEAVVMTRQVVDCVAPFGIVDMGVFSGDDKKGILSYCGFDDAEVERFFVRVVVLEALPLERTSSSLEPSALEMKKVGEMYQGDSGALWVLKIFGDVDKVEEGLKKYEPGYSKLNYFVGVLDRGIEMDGKIEVEVLVSNEF